MIASKLSFRPIYIEKEVNLRRNGAIIGRCLIDGYQSITIRYLVFNSINCKFTDNVKTKTEIKLITLFPVIK
jgi:hypothetical protein